MNLKVIRQMSDVKKRKISNGNCPECDGLTINGSFFYKNELEGFLKTGLCYRCQIRTGKNIHTDNPVVLSPVDGAFFQKRLEEKMTKIKKFEIVEEDGNPIGDFLFWKKTRKKQVAEWEVE